MKSRYDYMTDSSVRDVDNENYFDPLSISYNDVQLTKAPPQYTVKDGDITKPWLMMNKNYGVQDRDDILLNLNGIPYIGSLTPGDVLFLVDLNDIDNFQSQKLSDAEDN